MKKILILLLSLGLILAVVIGCGSDDNEVPTDPDNLETGSLTDADFLFAQQALYGAEDFSDEMFVWMEFFIDSVFGEIPQEAAANEFITKLAADTVLATYHAESEYWYMFFRHVDTVLGEGDAVEDIITVTLWDSIQFIHGDNPVQWPDSTLLTSVKNGAALVVTTQTGLGNATATQDVTVVGAPGAIALHGDVTLGGTRTFVLGVTDEAGTCSVELDASATATALAMNITEMEDGGCPQSGNLVHVATITIECTGDTTFTFTDTWTVGQTFHGDYSDVVVENSTTRWTFTDTCNVPVAVSRPYAEMFSRIREQ